MRFDDSLSTVLSADMESSFGAQSAWRQLVDLVARGRAAADEPVLARLRILRQAVPVEVRAATARAIAVGAPDPGLIALFAEDEPAVAAPVLRDVTLPPEDWIELLPRLGPTGRAVLRHRQELPDAVRRALDAFGSSDFVLGFDEPDEPELMLTDPIAPPPVETAPEVETEIAPPIEPGAPPPAAERLSPTGDAAFVAVGEIARHLPLVEEARRRTGAAPSARESGGEGFAISDLVARIDAFQRTRGESAGAEPAPAAKPEGFRFETDANGVIRWVQGVSRAALIGISLAHTAPQGQAQLDGIATGALRRRSAFSDARLRVEGSSDAAGTWLLSGVPAFDDVSGRFTGLRGSARRPRRDETTGPARSTAPQPAAESLRHLTHELRTPTNAIAGFAELIEAQLLGPVPSIYRERATAIRIQAAELLAAIEDLDTAARIESNALELSTTVVAVAPLVARIVGELEPLARLRGVTLAVLPAAPSADVAGDQQAVERLLTRLLTALVAASGEGERMTVAVTLDGDDVTVTADRPSALGPGLADALFTIDRDADEQQGGPLLGTGFALRLAQNLAAELGGSLMIAAPCLTLRLPAALGRPVEQASTN